MSKKNKLKGKKLPATALQKEILKYFGRHNRKSLNPKQLAKKLKIENNRDSVLDALRKLSEEGKLIEVDKYKFKLKPGQKPRSQNGKGKRMRHEGVVDMTRNGDAYIICHDCDEDVHVSAKNLNSALHGDLVEIEAWHPHGKRRAEGKVKAIKKRATENFMGNFQRSKEFGFVVPDKLNMPMDIYVLKKDFKGAKDGDKVVVRIIEWHNDSRKAPRGEITTVLGDIENSDLEMKSILVNNGFPLDFSEAAIQESEDLPSEIPAMEINRRRDFRNIKTFTIDPEDAKDFDDALSLEYLDDGSYRVGVHIADVTHFVKPGSMLDKEAYERATSVYLVDRVLPMLPERISNDLCSLRPDEDRLTFSVVFHFDENDELKDRWFGKGIIHSDHRFSYEAAQQILESDEDSAFSKELRKLNQIARKLHDQRFSKGSIDFDAEEVRFRLDEDGVPVEVFVKERKEVHLLVEDFMLLANKEVAIFMNKKGESQQNIPFVYRVHDLPDPDKVAEFAAFAREMGFNMNVSTPKKIANSYNNLAKAARKNEALKILEPIAIRTMSKAEYTTENIGHYGLGFDNYTHFTSPIRRYSDILVHRILEANLDDKTMRIDKEKLDGQCKHISMQERKAMDAERESIKYKQAEFMKKHIGNVFDGYISGIIDKGIFVALQHSKAEGLIGFESFNESFEIDPGRLKAVSTKTGKTFKMGDAVKVRILQVDLAKRQIDMELTQN